MASGVQCLRLGQSLTAVAASLASQRRVQSSRGWGVPTASVLGIAILWFWIDAAILGTWTLTLRAQVFEHEAFTQKDNFPIQKPDISCIWVLCTLRVLLRVRCASMQATATARSCDLPCLRVVRRQDSLGLLRREIIGYMCTYINGGRHVYVHIYVC